MATKIDIISGFLGAGKTTLIKKLLKEAYADEQVVLIENEFGEIGIDGGFLKEAGIEIREMNSGCICCSLVGDFGASLKEVTDNHEGVYAERTGNRYLLHAQVGASNHEEDKRNAPAHRIRVGEEPTLLAHLKQSAPFHKYFPSGTGDLFAFDQTYVDHLDAVVDIIDGSFAQGYRYITTYLKNTDLIRVTGYLVKKSEVEKYRKGEVALRDTTWYGSGTDDCAQVFDRQLRDEQDVSAS